MKNYLKALLALGLFMALAMPAQASWNIRQKGNGSTVWTDGTVEVPTGDSGLVLHITNVSTANTRFVVSHKKGKIKKVYAVAGPGNFGVGARPVLTISIGNGTSATFTPISAGATISMVTTIAGGVASVEPADVNVDVNQGSVIAVGVGGTSTGIVDATITIVIE